MGRAFNARYPADWRKFREQDGRSARVVNGRGEVVGMEYYQYTGKEWIQRQEAMRIALCTRHSPGIARAGRTDCQTVVRATLRMRS